MFDRNRLLVRSQVFGQSVLAILDTGADTTDLNESFAVRFASTIERATRTSHALT